MVMVSIQAGGRGGKKNFFVGGQCVELFHDNYRFFIIAMVTNRELERMI